MRKGESMSTRQKNKISKTKKRLYKNRVIIPWNKGIIGVHHLSEETKRKISINNARGMLGRKHKKETIIKMRGSKNSNWKGGKYINKSEKCVYVRCPTHPRAKNNRGYVAKHILVMEKHLGRYLKKGEVVHHIDGNRMNNSIKNLKLFKNNGKHISFHHKIRREIKL